jgi:hypothetical protein
MACEWFAAYVCGLCLPKESCSGLRLTAHDFSRIYQGFGCFGTRLEAVGIRFTRR